VRGNRRGEREEREERKKKNKRKRGEADGWTPAAGKPHLSVMESVFRRIRDPWIRSRKRAVQCTVQQVAIRRSSISLDP
jgi:hypothetical protein